MKNKILILTLVMALCCNCFGVVAATAPITATGGAVVIDTVLEGTAAGVPVLVVILPQINDAATNEDITKSSLPAGSDALTIIQTLKSSDLNIEYFDVALTGEGGSLKLNCQMKSSLSTGNVQAYLKYLGSEDWVKLGDFEHIGQDDITYLLSSFNGERTGYESALQTDVNGNRLLEKSSADLTYYAFLLENKADLSDDFCDILFNKRPENGFDMVSLVSTFNEACAWIQLREQEDTLGVLNRFNEVYWKVPTDSADFTDIPETEQVKILASVKNGNHSDKDVLLNAFGEELALAMFRTVSTREALDSIIAENGAYATCFEEARTVLANGKINEYQKLLVYNYVLDRNENCEDFAAVAKLFSDAVLSVKKSSSIPSGGGGGGGGGGSAVTSRPISGGIVTVPPETKPEEKPEESVMVPFNDVAEGHWAYAYVKKLYSEKVINGVSETEFAPASSIKRQDFVKILVGILDLELSLNDSTFSDLSIGCYYEPYIMTAAEQGLISGVGDGSFGMNADITREDVAVIIGRVLKDKTTEGTQKQFNDAEKIADYAKDAVEKVVAAEIFSGDDMGNFNPKAKLSRAEACAVLCRLADRVKGVSK